MLNDQTSSGRTGKTSGLPIFELKTKLGSIKTGLYFVYFLMQSRA
jgi:hypothetical protein